MNGMQDQKKLILSKLFKGQKAGSPPGSAGSHGGVQSSFNDQLMNQTNFGYNPARGTIVHQNGNEQLLDQLHSSVRGDRQSLNTQKRNRTTTIDGASIPQSYRANHVQELNQTYASVLKPVSRGNYGNVMSSRQAHHQQAMSIFTQQSQQ